MSILEEPIKEPIQIKNYINGEWVDTESGVYEDVINPATQKVIAKVPISTREELNRAVEAALEAYPRWSETPPLARVRLLFRLKELLEENFETLSRIQTMEHGKTIDESRGETRRRIENVEVATGITSFQMGYLLQDVAVGIDEFAYRVPLGVFGIIPPFNFPFMVPLWFAPYAVATGNCIIIKPSREDPISQFKLAELAEEAGFPPGVWNVVNGGREVVSAMLENPNIKGICFVGSTRTGKFIYQKCGEYGKRCIAQCGAKNFVVVMPDAVLERTIPACMTSFFGNTGQRCLSGANLVICGEGLNETEFNQFYEKIVNAFVDSASKIRVGYGLDERVQMGPLRDKEKKQRMLEYIEKGIEEGAKLVLDGRNIKLIGDWPHDAFLNPTVFTEVTPDMFIGREELFGPIASIMRARTLDEAIEMINNHPIYANASTIFTQSGKWAREFIYRVQTGGIGINIGIVASMAFFPFPGMKQSFFGVLHGQKESIDFFTDRKVVIQRWF